jgi:hypothetical protein
VRSCVVQRRAEKNQAGLCTTKGVCSCVQFAGEGSGRGDTGGSISGSEHEHGKGLGGTIAVRAYQVLCWSAVWYYTSVEGSA